jgi:ABC-type branched-subunit amino acid transport system ATPase component/ABC-type branched-subunit amino acid transport system permease subunit
LNGLTIGLLAVGLVLVYKSNRFLNLAQGQLGTLSALLLAKWVLDLGWSWWIAFLLAVIIGTTTGLVVERLLVRRLRQRTRSPIRLLLLSLGVSQLLLALTYIPVLGPNPNRVMPYPQPFSSHLRIGGVVLSGMSVLTMLVVPVLVGVLAAFLRYSSLGKQIRAAANNPDAARLCGISVGRVSAVTWAMAGALSAIAAVLQAPTQPSFNIGSLGPYLLMLGLGAAAFGAFVSLPSALLGGLVLGLVSQVVSAETSNAADAEIVIFAVILGVVLLRGRAITRVFASSGSVVEERPKTRIPEGLRTSPLIRFQWLWMSVCALAVALVFPLLPHFNNNGNQFLLVLVLIYALVGVALTMLLGWGGQVSLGHFAVVGIAAYLAARWTPHGWTLPAMLLVTGLIGAFVMVAIGLPALRVPGLTLAVTTLGLAVVTPDWLLQQPWLSTGSSLGLTIAHPPKLAAGLGTPSSELSIYYVALVVLAVALAVGTALRHSIPGRVMVAVRDNERASAAFGINPAAVKLTILAVSGFFAAMAGVLWADAWRIASPSQFSADISIAVIAIPVIGGLGSLSGAVVAAVILYMGTFFVGPLVSPLFGSFGSNLGFQLFLAGIGMVGVLMSFPTGIAGLAQQRWQAYLDRRSQRMGALLERIVHTAPIVGADVPASPSEAFDLGVLASQLKPTTESDEGIWRSHLDRVARRKGAVHDDEACVPLVVEELELRFGGVVALDKLTMRVDPGEIVGLIGPNGAGKTTLLNVISGVLSAESGSVRLFGNEVGDLPPDYRAVFGAGRSFQEASLFAGLTVKETIQVALARRDKVGVVSAMLAAPWVRAAENENSYKADQIVAHFGLTLWTDALTSDLSTGTRRICDLAAQVAAGPKLLLLDEPTAGVAQRDAEAFGPLMRRIRDAFGCAILIVEHDMPLLMGMCDRVCAMELGRIIVEGTPEHVRGDPAVIASYLGSEDIAIWRSGDAGSVNSSGSNPGLPGIDPPALNVDVAPVGFDGEHVP